MSNKTLANALLSSMDAMDVPRLGASLPSDRIHADRRFHRQLRTCVICLVLLVLLLVGVGSANAAVIATLENRGGGKIMLLDEPGTESCNKGELIALTTRLGGGNTIFGCWTTSSGLVMIRWLDDNTISTFEISDFTGVEKPKPKPRPADLRT